MVYPVVDSMSTQEPEDVNPPTQSLFPTVGVLENKLRDSATVRPKTNTFVPFIPTILPKTSSSFTDGTPSMAAAEEKPTEEEEEGIEEEEAPPGDGEDGGEWDSEALRWQAMTLLPVNPAHKAECQGQPSLKI